MTEFGELAEGAKVAHEVLGVAETAHSAVEGVVDAAEGDWDGAADNALSMSEHAIGVATAGISEVAEKGWDLIAEETGLPTAHEALGEATQAAGEALGDAMFDLVGEEQSYEAAKDFDDGDILGGLGHMAQGAGETILEGVEGLGEDLVDGAESVGESIAEGAESIGESIAEGAEELWDEITD